jgi:hypothetical protein
MRLILILFLSLPINLFSQKYGAWGFIKNYNNLPKTVFLYERYSRSENECHLDESTSINSNDTAFYVIADTSCLLKEAYIVVYNRKKYLIDATRFENRKAIGWSLFDAQLGGLNTETRYQNVISQMPSLIEELKKEQEKKIQEAAIKEYEIKNADKIRDSLNKELDKLYIQQAKLNLVLRDWDFHYENKYSRSIDIDVTVENPFRKTIKYIWFTFKAYNPVDDPIKDGITGKYESTVRGIGPIDYGSKGVYNFESVFYSKVIETMRMTMIKIQFFDGSIKIINNPRTLKLDE